MRFFWSSLLVLFMTLAAARTASTSASAGRTPRTVSPSVFELQNKTFEFPGAGQRNNNESIGDFCCTGETATIRTAQGTAAGYIYFYGFSGGITNGKRSAAKRFNVLVSGICEAGQPAFARVKSSIDFPPLK